MSKKHSGNPGHTLMQKQEKGTFMVRPAENRTMFMHLTSARPVLSLPQFINCEGKTVCGMWCDGMFFVRTIDQGGWRWMESFN